MTTTTRIDRVNILLVDDQPSKLLTYETILGELGENLIKASSATEALECLLRQRHRRGAGGRVHAGPGRLRAGGDDSPASAIPEDGDHLRVRGAC